MTPNPGPTPSGGAGASGASDANDPTVLLAATDRSRGGDSDLLPAIPDFVLQGELGRGGMGIVYKAQRVHRVPDEPQTVAIKIIRKDRLQHDEAVKRFRREAQAAARLNHPNIVRVFDSDHNGDTHYLVMEYVAGVTLERHVEQHGAMPFALAVDFLRQTALALAHAHQQGLVHRDIKPSNIMIVPPSGRNGDGSPALVKVLDMGVARVLQSEHHPGEALSTLTQGGSVIGTADFVAPEQLEDPHGADIRADLYSLGCTFYFVLVGEVPFPGGSLISKLDKQRWQIPDPVNRTKPDIPPAVAEVIAKLLAKKPGERYQTPTEVLAALDELVRTKYESAVPPGPSPREVRVLKGHGGAVSCVAVSLDGRLAASSGKDQTIRIWDLSTGETRRVIARQPQEVRAVAFSPSGERLAAAIGVSLRLFDVATGQELQRLSGHSAAVRCVVFSPDDRWLYSGSDDKTLRIWDVRQGREAQRLTRHGAAITCLAISADGESLVSGSRDQTLRLWSLRAAQEARVWTASGGPVLAVAITPDGARVASAHFDTKIRLWRNDEDLPTGEFVGHKQMVTGVGFLPDGNLGLLSASQDQSLRWWDCATGAEMASLNMNDAGINALAIVPATRRVLVACNDGAVRVIEVPE